MEQVTLYCDFAERDEYRLLSADASYVRQLRDRATPGETLLVLKGCAPLLLCDDARSFRVRRVEYSNTLLIAEPSAGNGNGNGNGSAVVSAAGRVFEARPAAVSGPAAFAVALLRKGLAGTPLTAAELDGTGAAVMEGPTDGGTKGAQGLSFAQLLAQCECSGRELADALSRAGAVVYRGTVRLLDARLLRDALRAVLVFFDSHSNGHSYGSASIAAAEEFLCPGAFAPVVVRAVGAAFGPAEPPLPLSIGPVLRALAAAALCDRRKGGGGGDDEKEEEEEKQKQKEEEKGEEFPSRDFEAFYEEWVDSIPRAFLDAGGLTRAEPAPLLTYLYGAVIVRRARPDSYAGAVAVYAPHERLSGDMAQRVEQLFAMGPERWDAPALRAYVEPILDPNVSFQSVIQRYAKEFRVPNQPVTYGRLC